MTQQPQNGIQATNMTTFTWSITQLLTVPEPTPNYVVTANYIVIGIDEDYTASVESSAKFFVNLNKTNYIDYDQLTEIEILGWIKALPNVVIDMENCVQATIDSQKILLAIPQITLLPWIKD